MGEFVPQMRQLNDFLLNDLIVCFDLFGAVCVCCLSVCMIIMPEQMEKMPH